MSSGKLSSDTFWAIWCSVNALKITNAFSRSYSCLNTGHRTSRIICGSYNKTKEMH